MKLSLTLNKRLIALIALIAGLLLVLPNMMICQNTDVETKHAPSLQQDFTTTYISKHVNEFPDTFDLSSPIKACITCYYLSINGKNSQWNNVNTIDFKKQKLSADSEVSEKRKSFLLNSIIEESIIYKDTVACVISQTPNKVFSIRWFYFENGNWVNAGEDARPGIEECRTDFTTYAKEKYRWIKQRNLIADVHADTLAFVEYLTAKGQNPKDFVISKLAIYKLVMLGEVHFRKWSYDLYTDIVGDKHFAETTSTIFMEFPSNKQEDISRFMLNDTIDHELLLNIFRDYMVNGWNEKPRYDFIITLWHINKKLPDDRKIKLVFVDTPRVYTEEGIANEKSIGNRDSYMAKMISEFFETYTDKRNTLFIVGAAHVCKSLKSAGAILGNTMPDEVYTVFTHCPRSEEHIDDNTRLIRHGMFDYAFHENGDMPVAFDLRNSPFGKEPFDGLIRRDISGTFQNNYDGYIFLGRLADEPSSEVLYEIYNDDYVKEIDRRWRELYNSDFKEEWNLEDVNAKSVINHIKSVVTGKRW